MVSSEGTLAPIPPSVPQMFFQTLCVFHNICLHSIPPNRPSLPTHRHNHFSFAEAGNIPIASTNAHVKTHPLGWVVGKRNYAHPNLDPKWLRTLRNRSGELGGEHPPPTNWVQGPSSSLSRCARRGTSPAHRGNTSHYMILI